MNEDGNSDNDGIHDRDKDECRHGGEVHAAGCFFFFGGGGILA